MNNKQLTHISQHTLIVVIPSDFDFFAKKFDIRVKNI